MTNGIDRLERLFSRRKSSSARVHVSQPGSSIPQFPQAPYIRPKSTRMEARHEEHMPGSRMAGRAQSLPEPSGPPARLASAGPHHDAGSRRDAYSIHYRARVPERTSSLFSRRDASLASLSTFRFPDNASQSTETSSSPPASPSPRHLPPRLRLRLDGLDDFGSIRIPQQIDTPPSSDHEESFRLPEVEKAAKSLASVVLPLLDQPTPEPSPDISPVQDSQSAQSTPDRDLDLRLFSRQDWGEKPSRKPSRYRSSGCTTVDKFRVEPQAPMDLQPADPILKEPDFGDFLSLTDDDIAESGSSTPDEEDAASTAGVPAVPYPPPPSTPRSLRVRTSPSDPPSFQAPPTPNITPAHPSLHMPPLSRDLAPALSPVALAAQASTAAAFEASRIAARYGFDLVYIVNLWPKDMAFARGTSASSQATAVGSPRYRRLDIQTTLHDHGSPVTMAPRSVLLGSFLAAYGLATVKPFYLSAPTHSNILNADGWLEFRHPDPGPDGFARGYGRAYYATQAATVTDSDSDGWDADTESADEPGRTTPTARRRISTMNLNNCGIVFAGYRKTKSDGSDLGSDNTELDSLHRDVEALVGMILDFHTAKRRREQLEALRAATQRMVATKI